ncbi:Gfo/Idh/MocA family oxidoreductase [Nonomuraea muscovyensis]|uniref:Thiazolinyl imide reductase n=1 Tax=Nonomuraea muscovyensis TaxID=1124761 RepID=A0A7X0C5G0_9ACTN|nr:Gfo/Idh/MocA family oxidoreductase [Nonomuraea muscovyensis]MBB6347805.1 thiazolinyl imide reductase [Nonomuraea muscovyensis]MDF2704663.1 thiazolinyl imide reductase [Nonomuraea muscovyensis]
MSERTRVVVCGALFGQVYLRAFALPGLPLELAGILARGSDRSRAVAAHHGVPLFTDIDQIPGDVRMAAVVVRGGLLGGPGVELAKALMARGIHVLQEHPLHHDELADCLREARRNKVTYHLNPFYTNTAPVRRFVGTVAELLRRQRPRYVDAACGFQVAYSLLDILGQALGGVRPWALGDLAAPPTGLGAATSLDVPFRSLDGVIGGVPVTLRIQNQMDPADPDNYAHLMHRVVIGTEAGNLELVGTHGPVVWSPRPDFPRAVRDPAARPHFDYSDTDAEALRSHLDVPSAGVLGPAQAPSYRQIFEEVWPAGVAHALMRLRRDALAGDPAARRGQYHLTLCKLWQEITTRLGPPELLSAPPPRLLDGAEIAELDKAGREAEQEAP